MKTYIATLVSIALLAVHLSSTTSSVPAYQETAIPRATQVAMRETLQDALADETCVLPCFMGWTLGEDNRSKVAQNFERLFTVEADFRCEDGYCRTGFFSCLATSVPRVNDCFIITIWVNDQAILAGIGTFWETSFAEEWLIPVQLGTRYGLPDNVEIAITDTSFTRFPHYELVITYPARGLYVRFSGWVERKEDNSRNGVICPSSNVQNIEIWVQSEPIPDNGPWIELVSDEEFIEDDFEPVNVEITDENFEDIFYDPEACFIVELPE